MKAAYYRAIQVFSVMVILAAEMVLSFILIWLIKGHGIIACGRGISDDPAWFADVLLMIGIPFSMILGGVMLFLWCSSRRLFVSSL